MNWRINHNKITMVNDRRDARTAALPRYLLLLWLLVMPSLGVSQAVDINALKAVFLFNFSNFIDWPKSSFNDRREPIRYCTLGNLKVHKNLVQLTNNEKVKGRRFEMMVVNDENEVMSSRCHLLFVSDTILKTKHVSLSHLLSKMAENNILTIGESSEFITLGGMIYLKHRQKRIRIEIGIKNVRKSQLEISSKLLRLAEIK